MILFVTISGVAGAMTATWTGDGADRYWSTPVNWEGGTTPIPSNDLSIVMPETAARYNPIVDFHNPWVLNRLAISNNSYSVSGNTLEFCGVDARIIVGPGSHGFGFSTPVNMTGALTVEMKLSYNFYMDGEVSGLGPFILTGGGAGTARRAHFRKAATYSGATRLFGWFVVGGAGGRITDSSIIELFPNGSLILGSGGVGAAENRIADTIPVHMYGGPLFNYNSDETLDEVTARGGLGYFSMEAGVLRVGRLVRHQGGSIRIRGASSLGLPDGARLLIGAIDGVAPLDLLVGGAGPSGSTTVSIVPCLQSDGTFVTHDAADGFRRLDTVTEYVDGLDAAGPYDNVTQSNSVTLASNTVVNSLRLPSYSLTLGGDYTLTLNSGALLTSQNTRNQTISTARLDFNGREAFISVHNTGGYSTPLTISGVITNAAGLTFAGTHNYNTASSPLYLSGANVYSGRTAVLVGILELRSGDNRLPVSSWVSVGYGARLSLNNVSQTVTGLEGEGTVHISHAGRSLTVNNAGDFTLNGAITGAGRLIQRGVGMQTLGGACTYTGDTMVTNGVLRINGSLSAADGAVTVYSGATLSGTGTIGRAVNVSGGILAPGAPTGTLTVTSNVTFAADAGMRVTLTPDTVSRLVADGDVTLGGALDVVLEDGYTPPVWQTWEIIAANTVTGKFAAVPAGFTVRQTEDSVTLRVKGYVGGLITIK